MLLLALRLVLLQVQLLLLTVLMISLQLFHVSSMAQVLHRSTSSSCGGSFS
jgi:hypothetical protein